MATIPVQTRQVAIKYDGTNSAEILAMFNPQEGAYIVSEANGVLDMFAHAYWGEFTIAQGQYLVFTCNPDGSRTFSSAPMTLTELQAGYVSPNGSVITG